jgi:hypothetical protein
MTDNRINTVIPASNLPALCTIPHALCSVPYAACAFTFNLFPLTFGLFPIQPNQSDISTQAKALIK